MPAPGEFFPQQFAQAILGVAQAQKQFQARLREQRSLAAARNFMDKQRLELAEEAQSMPRQSGENQARSGIGTQFSATGGFRQRSAESAIGVRDQLTLERGTRAIDREARLRDRADEALIPRVLSDLQARGFAYVPDYSQDSIAGIRDVVQAAGGKGPAKEVVTAEGVATGEFVQDPAVDFAEFRVGNGTVLVRVGGETAADQKAAADLAKAKLDAHSTMQDIALTNMKIENARLMAEERIQRLRQIAQGLGSDDPALRRMQGIFNLAASGERVKSTILERLEDERSALQKKELVGEAVESERMRLRELNERIASIENKDSLTVVREANKNLAPLFTAIDDAKDAAAMAQAQANQQEQQSGVRPRGDPELLKRLSQTERRVYNMEPLDLVDELTSSPTDSGQPLLQPEEGYKALPVNVSLPLRNSRSGEREDAQFHSARQGLIPLNRSAVVVSRMIEKATPAQAQAALRQAGVRGAPQLRLHPLWKRRGFQPGTARLPEVTPVQPEPLPPEPAAPPSAADIEGEVDQMSRALDEMGENDPRRDQIINRLQQLSAQGQ